MAPTRTLVMTFLLVLVAAGAWIFGFSDLIAPELGPVDGRNLPPEQLDRVQVGDEAPDFVLEAYSGGVRRLSDYRGKKNVVLVFYRGHW